MLNIVAAVALLAIVSSPWWADKLFFTIDDAPSWDLAAVPGLIAATFAWILFVSRRKEFLRLVMCSSLLARLAATGVFVYVSIAVYDGTADALNFNRTGTILAQQFFSTGELPLLHPMWSNNFVIMVVRTLFILFWPSFVLGMVVFSLLAFAGQYFAYRAYSIAYPAARQETAAVMIFLLPSLLFWTSAIGKDSLSLFFIGLLLYSTALYTVPARKIAATAVTLFALAGIFLVRPHVGAIISVAMLLPYVLLQRSRVLGAAALKAAVVPALVGVSLYLAVTAASFVGQGEVAQVDKRVLVVASANRLAGSAFGAASVGARVVQGPFMFFRPFPWEVRSSQSALAAAEALLLLVITWRLRKQVLAFLRSRPGAFTWFLVVFLAEFMVIFSVTVTNFGLLARERVMAMPFLLLLLCRAADQALPPRKMPVAVAEGDELFAADEPAAANSTYA